jgi:hypothetical protein
MYRRVSMDNREERVVLETARHRITGTLRLPRDGYRSRLTDYLNAAERSFIALTDVVIESLDGDRAVRERAYIAVSLSQIALAMPADASRNDAAGA